MLPVQFDKPPVDLLVLSACETALGNEKAELGFAGFASQAKAKSVLASLSRVDEQATLKLMTEFYKELQTAPIKAEALRQAQLTLLNGEMNDEMKPDKLSHPYNWAWFTIVGSPW
jgi:CHAT domain-containing protein